jgi:hypothetical protein
VSERHNPNVKKLAFLLTLSLGLSVAGCASGAAATVAVQSPVDTVYSFFKALNSGDVQSADAYLASDSMLSRGGAASPPDLYANLSCRPGSEFNSEIVDSATKAVVACEFDIREDWDGFSATHYNWGVWLERQALGPWLIHDWGQPIGPW